MFSFLIPLLEANKFFIASVTSVVFLAFAGLTLAASVVALVVSTPLFIIFSPILVPATIATCLLATGFTAGATLGLTAIGLIIGLIKSRTVERTSLAMSAQTPFKLLKISGGYWGFWGGKKFSGSFGDIAKWLKKQPWFKGAPAADGAAPAAGGAAPPADGAAPPAGGAAPPADGAAPPAGGAAPPAGGAAPPAAGAGAAPPAAGAAPPAAGAAPPAAGAAPPAAGAAPPAGGAAPPAGGAAPKHVAYVN